MRLILRIVEGGYYTSSTRYHILVSLLLYISYIEYGIKPASPLTMYYRKYSDNCSLSYVFT